MTFQHWGPDDRAASYGLEPPPRCRRCEQRHDHEDPCPRCDLCDAPDCGGHPDIETLIEETTP